MTEYNGTMYNDDDIVEYTRPDGSIENVTAKVAKGRQSAQKYTEIRANAKKVVREFLNDKQFSKLPEDVQESIKILANAMDGKRSGGFSSGSTLMNKFRSEGIISKADLFNEFELGTPSMQTKARTWAKNGSLFVRETVDGKAWEAFPEMPADWKGAKPVETEAI